MSLGGGGMGDMFGGGPGGGFQPMGLLQMLTGAYAPQGSESGQGPQLETKQLPGFSGSAGAIPLYGKQAQQNRNMPSAAGAGPASAFDMPLTENSSPAEAMQFLMANMGKTTRGK